MIKQLIFMTEVISAAFVLWLGLYVITRDLPWRNTGHRRWLRTPLMAGLALIFFAIYVYGNAMEVLAESAAEYFFWQRLTWWVAPLAVLLFLWSVIVLFRHEGDGLWMRLFYVVTLLYAVALAVGIASGSILDEAGILPRSGMFQPYYTPMKSPYVHFFQSFLLGVLMCAFLIMLFQYRRTAHRSMEYRRLRILLIGSLASLVGGLSTMAPVPLEFPVSPKQVGDFLITFGAAMFAYSIARFNALEHEQILYHDFLHSITTVAISVAVYVFSYMGLSLVVGYPISPIAVIILSALAVITQTSYNWGGGVLDRILLPRWAVGYRSRLVLMRQESITAADPTRMLQKAEESFSSLIRTVRRDEIDEVVHDEIDYIFQYSRFDSDEILSESKLQSLATVQVVQETHAAELGLPVNGLSEAEQAQTLRMYLTTAIDEWLCTNGQSESSAKGDPDPEMIEQVILRKKYAEGLSRTAVEHNLLETFDIAVTGGAYSRHLKQARTRLADAILDHELSYLNVQNQPLAD